MARKEELAEQIERGEYRVDPHAVAEAMLKRSVLVPAQPLDRAVSGAQQDEAAPDPDVA